MSYTLGVDTLNQKLTADHTEGKIGSWVNDPGDVGKILVGKSSAGVGAVIKIVGASTPGIWDYEVILGTTSDILNGFWYPNVYRVLLDVGGTDADDEYFYYDNGIGPYPWPGETAPPPAGSYQYFRISISANGGNANFTALQEIELATYEGGSDITEAGMFTLSSSNETDRGPENLINNNRVDLDESWMTADGSPAPSWWYVNTLSFNHVTELRMLAKNNAEAVTRAPMDFDVEGSNDGSNWDIIQSITGETWTQGEEKSFIVGVSPPTLNPISDIEVGDGDLPQNYDMSTYLASDGGEAVVYSVEIVPTGTPYQYFRIYIQRQNGHSLVASMQEIELATSPAGADITSPGMPTSESSIGSGRDASNLISNTLTDANNSWTSADNQYSPSWVAVDTQGSHVVVELRILPQDNITNSPEKAPLDFNFEGSNDGTNWTVLKGFSGINDWVDGVQKTFSITPADLVHQYFKIHMATNNGDVFNCIQEIEIATTPAGADITSPGMATLENTSQDGSRTADKIIENTPTGQQDNWLSVSGDNIETWVYVDTAGSFSATEIRILPQDSINALARAPKDFSLYGSNDGTSWDLFRSYSGINDWTQGIQKTFDLTPAVQALAEDITINSSTGELTVADTTSIDTHATTMIVTNSQGQASEDFDIIVSGGGGATSYQHFRINVTANNGDGQYISIQEIELASFTDGGDFTTPGMTTSSSSEFDGTFVSENVIANTFKGVAGFAWHSADASPAPIQGFVAVDTGGSHVLSEVRMWCLNSSVGPARSPKDFTIEGSNDGTNWDVLSTEVGVTSWSNGVPKVFTVDPIAHPTPIPYQYFKLDIKRHNGDANYTSLQEVELALTTAGATITNPGMTCLALTELAGHEANGAVSGTLGAVPGEIWLTAQGQQSPSWWSIDTAGSHTLTELRIWSQNDSLAAARAPRDFDFQGSNDGSSWTTIKAMTNTTGWTAGVEKTFDLIPPPEGSYQRFRISISAHNGDIQFAGFQEIELATTPAGADITAPGMGSSASSFLSSPARPSANAIADTTSGSTNSWLTADGGQAPSWLEVNTAGSFAVVELRMWPHDVVAGPDRAPLDFTVEGSNDDINWDVIKSFTGINDWVQGASKTFDLTPPPEGSYQHYRIDITANNGDGSYTSVQEIELATTPAGADITSPGMSTDESSYYNDDTADRVIINDFLDASEGWVSDTNVVFPHWFSVDTATTQEVVELRMWTQNFSGGPARAPETFDFSGSNDGTNFDVIKSFTGITGWIEGGSKTFDLTTGVEVLAAIPAYQHYKIDISANNGALVTAIRAIEGRYAPSGNDSTAPGMACLASSTLASYTAAGVVDNLGTGWASAIGQGSPSWWSVDTGSQIEVREVEIWAQILSSGAERAPMDFDISGSNDGSNWTVIKSFVGVNDWVVGGSKIFDLT